MVSHTFAVCTVITLSHGSSRWQADVETMMYFVLHECIGCFSVAAVGKRRLTAVGLAIREELQDVVAGVDVALPQHRMVDSDDTRTARVAALQYRVNRLYVVVEGVEMEGFDQLLLLLLVAPLGNLR